MAELEKHDSADGTVVDHKTKKDSDTQLHTKEVSSPDHSAPVGENTSARLANPLEGLSRDEVLEQATQFCRENGLEDHVDDIRKGALIAQDPLAFEELDDLDEKEREYLRREMTHRWDHPRQLYLMTVMCSVAAAVQGMDESVINGALLFFPKQFNIASNSDKDQWLQGLIGAAPYICCAFLGCWLTAPLNNWFGRRGTIFITAVFSALTCFWSGVTNSWQHLLVSRIVLGIGIGPKSATVPVYAAECAPPLIRGALVMQWQTWTAFGIMLGYVADLILYKIPDVEYANGHIYGLPWRLMLGSAGLPAIFVAAQVFFCPESPRWLMKKGRYAEAYQSLLRLRNSPIQASRDLYFAHVLLVEEAKIARGRFLPLELFTVPRNARATAAALWNMFGQQFCGVNVIAYYSSSVLSEAGLSDIQALLGSFGFGALNFTFAIPAWFTIDTFGRRTLLLFTYPFLAMSLLLTGFSFFIPLETHKNARIGVVLLGIYLYACFYSPGMGPVPFTYAAEAYPLYIRDYGMSLATAVLWFFNALLAVTFFKLKQTFTPQGAFGWYAAWCIILWIGVAMFMPETKQLSLEELDQVFSVPTTKHAAYQIRQLKYGFKKNILRQKGLVKEELYHMDPSIKRHAMPAGGAA
ncbi:hypothetical protein OC846_004629 [Tilletia horrida]|uniref:Major facilitator superfamily (MFS) profile domain-containing protein n=1 Tax=Tilletia horrida TaxID=155126 RepID=A0AAN6GLX7_9BASI|nr:hypothetical protein OC846_004629 [Tilletia horrida]KAK0563461.1 hypothetical protein OC861_004790 [Tilletia horrida]